MSDIVPSESSGGVKRSHSSPPTSPRKKPTLDILPHVSPTAPDVPSDPINNEGPSGTSLTTSADRPASEETKTTLVSEASTANPLIEKKPDHIPIRGKGRREYRGKTRRALPSARPVDGEVAKAQRLAETVNTNPEEITGDDGVEGEGDGVKRLPKKRVALLIGYCGTGYSGMQIQPGEAETIEGELFQALVKAGAVSSDNSNDHRKVDVQRAARTDAGVHAAGNCVSLKMIINPVLPPEHETLKSLVNSYLPEQIRMWGFVRCIKSFDARTSCDSRIYEYLLPSYCLLPPTASSSLAKQLDSSSPGWREGLGPGTEFVNAAPPLVEVDESAVATDTPARRGEYERRRNWRVDEGTMGRFRGLMRMYLGSHNFHNYTVGRPFHDRAVKRHMIQIDVLDPKVYGEIEWISVQIHGQSFMLHQIRKMISMAVLACRTGTPAKIISETYGSKRIHIPKAPPLGLLLEAPQFKTYNKRIRENSHQYDHEPVDYTSYAEEIMAFKVKYIYERLRQEELERHVFQKWTRQMDGISDNILRFLNTNGIIPDEATIPTGPTPKKRSEVEEVGSDEEVDAEQLKRGELEG